MPAAADRQRELVFANQHNAATEHLTENHLVNLCWLEGIGHKHLEVVAPPHDVDPLSTEFFDDVLDTVATHAHARTDAVDTGVGADHGNLAAIPGLPRDRTDLNHTVGDLWDFLLKQPLHKLRTDTGEDDLDPASLLPNLENRGPDPLIWMVRLTRNLLAAGQDRLSSAKRHGGHRPLMAAYNARHHEANLLFILVVDRVSLSLADLLNDHLLGRLSTDAARKFLGVDFDAVMRAADTAVFPINSDHDFGVLAILFGERRDERRLNRPEDDLFVDVLVAMDGVYDAKNFVGLHGAPVV